MFLSLFAALMAYWLYYFGRNSGRPLGHKVSPCPARPPPLPSGGGSRQINSAAAFSLNTQIFKHEPNNPGPTDQPSHLPSPTLPFPPSKSPRVLPVPPALRATQRTAATPAAVRCVFVCDCPTCSLGTLTCVALCVRFVGVVCLMLLWVLFVCCCCGSVALGAFV